MIRETDITLPLFENTHPVTVDMTVTWVGGYADTILLRSIRPRGMPPSHNVDIQDASVEDRNWIRKLIREAEKRILETEQTVELREELEELRAVALQLGVDNAKLRSTMEKIRELISCPWEESDVG